MMESKPKKLDVWFNEVIGLYQQGKVKDALLLTNNALVQFPDNSRLLGYAGTFSMLVGELESAFRFYQKSLIINPDNPDVINNLASLHVKQNKFVEAEKAYRRTLLLKPDFIEVYNNLGNLLEQQKRYQEAESCFRHALKLNPNYAEAYNNWGNLALKQNKHVEAEALFKKALLINPEYVDAYNNQGNLFCEQGRLVEAEKSLQNALKLQPNHVEGYINLGNVYKEKMDNEKAREAYHYALLLRPDCAEAYNNLGGLLLRDGQYEEAITLFHKAIDLRGNYIDAQFRLSLALLILGHFHQGWPIYEVRYHPDKKNRQTYPPDIKAPQWKGESLVEKTLLIWPEQGLGDEIQFVRYLFLLKHNTPNKLVLVCKKPLEKVFGSLQCVDRVICLDDFEASNLDNIDYWTFVMSLPLFFQTTLETIPAKLPYLRSFTKEQSKWKRYVPQDGFRVGLVWKGNKNHKNDINRSLPSLDLFKPLWEIENITFISLQKGPGEDEAKKLNNEQFLIHLGDKIQDFSDTAAIISQLDLVICVDTAIAHLVGALNKSCWVLLPKIDSDWRWLLDTHDSPWYPNVMRLFRQQQAGNWEGVISEVKQALKVRVS